MIILGIDPGLATTGYGFIDCGSQFLKLIDAGVVRTFSKQSFPDRLKKIYGDIASLISQYKPGELAIESVFYARNARAAIEMGHARGVIVLAAVQQDMRVVEYAARVVKQAIVGHGAASKQQVQRMVKELLHLELLPRPFDMADAIAIGLCHALRWTKC